MEYFIKSSRCDSFAGNSGTTCDCGITDTFTRTVAQTSHTVSGDVTGAYIGNSDAGPAWSITLHNSASAEVNGTAYLASTFPTGGVSSGRVTSALPVTTPNTGATKSFRFSIDTLPPGSLTVTNTLEVNFGMNSTGLSLFARVSISGMSGDTGHSFIA